MSSFRPNSIEGMRYLDYSPWCEPTTIHNIRCVIVDSAMKDFNVMAWDFVMNFAKDNQLKVTSVEH